MWEKIHQEVEYESTSDEFRSYQHGLNSESMKVKKTQDVLQVFAEYLRLHAGEKPCQFNVCGKRFIKKWNMKVHQMNSGHINMV